MASSSSHGSPRPTAILPDDLEISKPVFLKSYEAAVSSRRKRLRALVKSPDEEAVHDARTAVRRLEAHIEVLPGKVRRSAKMAELQKRDDRVMRLTAEVRDLDVIVEEVVRQDAAAKERLLSRIDEDRMEAWERAAAAMAAGLKARPPSIDPEDLSQARLQERFEKVARRLAREIEKLMPLVVADPDEHERLHKLRIKCKKLRYVLELALVENSPLVARLSRWQTALGEVHDWDMTLSYLNSLDPPPERDLLLRGEKRRERQFRAFARSTRAQGAAG